MRDLYPDLYRRGERAPSVIRQEALDWVRRDPEAWRPDTEEPSDVLAVIGLLALSAQLHHPAGWDGAAVYAPRNPIAMIMDCHLHGWGEGEHGDITQGAPPRSVLRLSHFASKVWAGRLTREKIWSSNHAALRTAVAATNPDESEVAMDWAAMVPVTATGYDRRAVNVSLDDGFSVAMHERRIRIVGARPAVELYALIGASAVEAAGRWPTRPRVQIPAIRDVVLRDWLDMQRWMMLGATMARVRVGMSGKRGYLHRDAE